MFEDVFNSIKSTKDVFIKKFSNAFNFLNNSNVEKEIDKRLEEFENKIKSHIEDKNPFENAYRDYRKSYNDFKYNGADEKSILDDINHYKKIDSNADTQFFKSKLEDFKNKYNKKPKIKQTEIKQKIEKEEFDTDKNNYYKETENNQDSEDIKIQKDTDIKAIRKSVLDNWKNSLDNKYIDWSLNEIDKFREEFFKQIKEFLDYLKDIMELENALGEETGSLFDLSLGNLLKRDIEYIKQLANLIKSNENIKKLCDMLGRFVKEEESYRIEKVLRKETFHTSVRDINSEDEIVGITYSRDIHNILPQEKLLLAEGVLETLFGVKYFENRLLTFKKEGYTDYYYDEMIEDEMKVVEDDKKGPIIICVDTSGSMSGVPETVAKAVTLYLASRAMKQKRNCYLINFSTQIETMDLTYPNTMDNLIEFLRLSFNGGTDAVPALRHAIKTMNTENYKKSDLLFISDFVFNGFTDDDYKLAEAQKKNENRFYSLIIGSTPLFNVKNSIFDYNWCYDSSRGSVKEITENMYSNIFNI
ncbi:VWA domain-containing protein [Brachyspira murdochii]|uniref:von Willebrand factor type A n=1 Tax=Brachyspira murdochii (strain ATCC 51284 / DSM 12563 / 56-150) TaxID=526224 RepID=D5U7S9_BRAM5|nr:VWA domain-containing protein [Brachyspira murdochii]ADG72875.1 von Willebrand factor type A [Brachyspira murdochii DSM 12563]